MNSGMRQHLDDEQIAASVVETDRALNAHLRECTDCNAKAEQLRASLAGFGGFVRHNAERANTFWWRQHAAAPASEFPLGRLATSVAALVIASAAGLSYLHNQQHKPAFIPAPTQQISDEALLSEVETDVQREYPDALAPVETDAESAVAAAQALAPKKEHKKK